MGSCLCEQVELKPEKDTKQLQIFEKQKYPIKKQVNTGLFSQDPQSLSGFNKAPTSNGTSNQETSDSKIKVVDKPINSGGKSNAQKYLDYEYSITNRQDRKIIKIEVNCQRGQPSDSQVKRIQNAAMKALMKKDKKDDTNQDQHKKHQQQDKFVLVPEKIQQKGNKNNQKNQHNMKERRYGNPNYLKVDRPAEVQQTESFILSEQQGIKNESKGPLQCDSLVYSKEEVQPAPVNKEHTNKYHMTRSVTYQNPEHRDQHAQFSTLVQIFQKEEEGREHINEIQEERVNSLKIPVVRRQGEVHLII